MSVVALALLATIAFSCQKEKTDVNPADEPTEADATAMVEESMEAESSFDDVTDVSLAAAIEEGIVSAPDGRFFPFLHLRARLGPCVDITVTPNDTTYPKTITIDFGAGCLCADGKFRKGAIIITLSAPIRRTGSSMTITFRDFYLNRAHIEGTKLVTNLSTNGNIKFSVKVTGGTVTFPNGRGFAYESVKMITQIDGSVTAALPDDVFQIEGRSKTIFNGGLTITLDTETPLVKKVACRWINEGKLKIRINNRVFMLDYAAPDNGDCDNKAMLFFNGNSRLILIS